MGEITLEQIKDGITGEELVTLIPNVQIFKEIMVELIKNREIVMKTLQEERQNYISEFSGGFHLNEMLLALAEEFEPSIQSVEVYRIEDGKMIAFEHVTDETGASRRICCSNVLIRVRQEA